MEIFAEMTGAGEVADLALKTKFAISSISVAFHLTVFRNARIGPVEKMDVEARVVHAKMVYTALEFPSLSRRRAILSQLRVVKYSLPATILPLNATAQRIKFVDQTVSATTPWISLET